jgi:serine/threonine protein phosphatase PrpC
MKKWVYAGSKHIGPKHVLQGKPCQDDISFLEKNNGISIALADGLSSQKHSDLGANFITKLICDYVLENFETLISENTFIIKRKIGNLIYDKLLKFAQEKECNPLDFASTLLFVCVFDDQYILGHLGDGIILSKKGLIVSIISNPEDVDGDTTKPYHTLHSEMNAHIRIQKGKTHDIDGFILMSDGVPLYQGSQISSHIITLFNKMNSNLLSDFQEYLDLELSKMTASKQNVTKDDCSIVMLTLNEVEDKLFSQSKEIDSTLKSNDINDSSLTIETSTLNQKNDDDR